MLTTADFSIDGEVIPNEEKMTTLPPFPFQHFLRRMADHGCDFAVIEVTSHAMDQSRLWGVSVDVAVLTNITHDHLDYHGSQEAYVRAKGKLFGLLNTSKRKPNIPKISIFNGDDAQAPYFQKFVADRTYIYGLSKGSFQATQIQSRANGSTFIFKIPNAQAEVQLPLPGRFNVENALAAATVAVALQINLPTIVHALTNVEPVPGRLEPIQEGQKYSVVVDYAHAPDSLEKLLSMFKPLTTGKLILVFGATGDRDRTKRPIMGQLAHRFADLIVLTDDDPYTEDRLQILKEVQQGIARQEGDRFWVIPDRRQAIRLALAVAREGDTVVVTGKGCESFQVVGMEKIPSDDRQIVRDFLSRVVEVELASGGVQTGNRYLES
jgi:UDP-N-acetylmuramoyl-L-alanyl-D-glutamate--2,6-diaminopimelate ligase